MVEWEKYWPYKNSNLIMFYVKILTYSWFQGFKAKKYISATDRIA